MDINSEAEDGEFVFSRNYFLAKELGSSSKKSTHKLSDIDVVDEQELRAAAANSEPKHEKEIATLIDGYKNMYSEWVFALRDLLCPSILLVVRIQKRSTVSLNIAGSQNTKAEVLSDQVKTKQKVFKSEQPFSSQSIEDLLAFLDEAETEDEDCFVCVVIHNIDGPALRDSETQHYLARLASCSHIRIVASIDHLNALLLWDKNMVHKQFNWCWHRVPTFAPYKVEGMYYPLILAQGGSNQSVKTATIVLQSLTPNAQSVFKVLVEHQLSHPDEEGMPISVLYSVCRERFLVSSQVTLNSHLTEFKGHELIRIRRHSNGQDCLFIPLAAEALQKVLLEINQ